MTWDRDGWIERNWRDLLLVLTAVMLLFFFGLGIWAIFAREDAEDITLQKVQELIDDNKRLTREVRQNQWETQDLLVKHRCRKEILMDLLLEKHGIKVPPDPHAMIPCPK